MTCDVANVCELQLHFQMAVTVIVQRSEKKQSRTLEVRWSET